MKKKIAFLAILMAVLSSRSFAQDAVIGVVSRIAAPVFEQNASDSRFAIVAEDETYYVMVDGYWPNPDLENLVIHYDTVLVGSEIEVVGTIVEMEDGNGEIFQAIDIRENLNSTYQQILGFFDNNEGAYFYQYNGFEGYHITINGELQSTPFVINGRTLVQNQRYLFVGICGDGVFELFDALPYDVEDVSIDGTLTMENDLCLSSPCGETHFLSLFDGEEYHYLTQKRKLQDNYINDAVFMEGDFVMVSGFEFVRYDLFGNPFKTLEAIKMQSAVEHEIVGGMSDAPTPYVNAGPPVPGVEMALRSNGVDYYILNPHDGDILYGFYVVGNDTIPVTWQQLTATCTLSMLINNHLDPFYYVNINMVDFEEHEETLQCTLVVVDNPFYSGEMLAINTQENETYFLKPYIYTFTSPDYITVGDNTAYVGDSFIAMGMVSNWYHNGEILEKVIDITEISNITGLIEAAPANLMVYPNPTDGTVQIVSGQQIKSISICDYTGRVLINKTCFSEQISLDLQEHKGLLLIQVILKDGQILSRKVVI